MLLKDIQWVNKAQAYVRRGDLVLSITDLSGLNEIVALDAPPYNLSVYRIPSLNPIHRHNNIDALELQSLLFHYLKGPPHDHLSPNDYRG